MSISQADLRSWQATITSKSYAPRCQLLHHQTKAVKEPPSPLQTKVSHGIMVWHEHKSTAISVRLGVMCEPPTQYIYIRLTKRRFFGAPGQGFGSLITREACAYWNRGLWGLLVGSHLFCVDMTDGAQQWSVLQVISGDIDGIINKHSLLLGGVRVLVLFVLFVFTKSGVLYICYFIHIFTKTKKKTLVILFCKY